MKKSVLFVLLSSVIAFGAVSAYAEHGEGKDRGAMFKEADTNNDGKLSYDEFKTQHDKRMDQMFKKLDANGDGFVDQAERKAAHEKMREHRKNCMKKMDDDTPTK
jgi:Ca2+-binding EF-hand superfamily protein